MISYQWTTAGVGLVLAGAILYLIRKDRLHTRYSAWWLAAAAVIVLFGFFPRLSDVIAARVGISYAPTLVLMGALGVLGLKTLFMDIERSQQELRLRRLAQRVAMLEQWERMREDQEKEQAKEKDKPQD